MKGTKLAKLFVFSNYNMIPSLGKFCLFGCHPPTGMYYSYTNVLEINISTRSSNFDCQFFKLIWKRRRNRWNVELKFETSVCLVVIFHWKETCKHIMKGGIDNYFSVVFFATRNSIVLMLISFCSLLWCFLFIHYFVISLVLWFINTSYQRLSVQ